MKNIKSALTNATIKARQKKTFFVAIIIGAVIGLPVLNHFTGSWEKPKNEKVKREKTSLVTSLDSIPAEQMWLYKSEAKIDDLRDQNKELRGEFDRIKRQSGGDSSAINVEYEQRLLELEERLATMALSDNEMSVVGGQAMPGMSMSQNYGDDEYYDAQINMEPQILSLDMGLKEIVDPLSGMKTAANFIPVGSFAKSVLLTGVDAPAAVSSSENPVPVLLKIVDNAVLPRGLRGEIDTCHVTASAYGEISEERVRVRLDKISCTYLDGRVFVDNIDGYVTGEDGKSGIRGKVVWREGALLARSFVAGLLGGVSQGIGDAAGKTSVSALGSVESYPGSELYQQGIGSGVGAALNKYAEYNIKRAELYHPVIEVEAGRVVDIIISTRKDSKSNGLSLGEEAK